MSHVPDPEGFVRYGGDCICGAIYTYAGVAEPGQFDPFCPDHGNPIAFTDDGARRLLTAVEFVGDPLGGRPVPAWALDDADEPIWRRTVYELDVCTNCLLPEADCGCCVGCGQPDADLIGSHGYWCAL